MKRFFLALAAIVFAAGASAEVRMPAVFGDNMVLQQQTDVNIWGWADAGKTVTIKASWDKKAKCSVTAGQDGKWKAILPTPVAGGPYSIEISDGKKLTLSDIMIGEVWVCSGQSNMEMPVLGFGHQPVEGSAEALLRAGRYTDKIRMFTVKKAHSTEPKDDCEGQWLKASFSTSGFASAVAYFFAEYVTDVLGVPVGIIMSDWGGSSIQTWMPETTLKECLKGVVTDEQFNNKAASLKAAGKIHEIEQLYNAMICPLAGYNAKGFLWYQGCSNLGENTLYDKMQAAMVARWRSDWGDKDNSMPFYYVAIAPHTYGDGTSFARGYFVENQLNAARITPNSDCAITETLGDNTGIIHPAKKREVSLQLALLALGRTYGINSPVDVGYPVPKEIKLRDDGCYEITFANANKGLVPFGGNNDILGFEVAGEDKVFHPVKAHNFRGQVVTDPCPEVPSPAAVRYSFRNASNANLTNVIGTPVPPFRSDKW